MESFVQLTIGMLIILPCIFDIGKIWIVLTSAVGIGWEDMGEGWWVGVGVGCGWG